MTEGKRKNGRRRIKMEMVLRIFMIVLGIVLLGKTFVSLAKRILTEHFGMLWGFFSVVLILAGILLSPTEWGSYISLRGLILVMITIFCVIEAAWFISIQVSLLIRKNQELAMQVSLLNQENEQILAKISELVSKAEETKE